MFPVYELKVKFTEKNTNAVTEDFVYIPASPQYLRPLAKILNPPLESTSGISVTLNAADTTKSPKANGVADFDFVFSYDTANPKFTIKWYLGDVTQDGANELLECQDELVCTIKAHPTAGDKPEPFTVSLLVRDDASPNASESSDVVQVLLNNGTFLPTVSKEISVHVYPKQGLGTLGPCFGKTLNPAVFPRPASSPPFSNEKETLCE